MPYPTPLCKLTSPLPSFSFTAPSSLGCTICPPNNHKPYAHSHCFFTPCTRSHIPFLPRAQAPEPTLPHTYPVPCSPPLPFTLPCSPQLVDQRMRSGTRHTTPPPPPPPWPVPTWPSSPPGRPSVHFQLLLPCGKCPTWVPTPPLRVLFGPLHRPLWSSLAAPLGSGLAFCGVSFSTLDTLSQRFVAPLSLLPPSFSLFSKLTLSLPGCSCCLVCIPSEDCHTSRTGRGNDPSYLQGTPYKEDPESVGANRERGSWQS